MAATAKNRKPKNRFVGTQIWEAQEEDILRGICAGGRAREAAVAAPGTVLLLPGAMAG